MLILLSLHSGQTVLELHVAVLEMQQAVHHFVPVVVQVVEADPDVIKFPKRLICADLTALNKRFHFSSTVVAAATLEGQVNLMAPVAVSGTSVIASPEDVLKGVVRAGEELKFAKSFAASLAVAIESPHLLLDAP